MPDYTHFKKTFCDCCKTKKDGNCKLGLQHDRSITDNTDFIDWEAVMDTKVFPEHDLPRCDSIYVRDNITFFIEQKNIRWFVVENTSELKNQETLTEELLGKFEQSKQLFQEDGNALSATEFVFSYDLNQVDKNKKAFLERNLRNMYFPYMESKGIVCGTCDQIAYYTIHGMKFK